MPAPRRRPRRSAAISALTSAWVDAAASADVGASVTPATVRLARGRVRRTRPSAQWKTGRVAGNSSAPGASVTARALALLGAFDEKHRRLTLTELADRAGLPVPTAHRLVGELVAWGALARRAVRASTSWGGGCGTSGCWRPCRPGCAAGLAVPPRPLRRHAAPPCTSRCATAPRCSTSTGSPGTPRCRWSARVGSRLPLHATGVGKVLLAHAPAEVQARGAGRPAPGHAVHRHPARACCAASSPGCVRDGYATTVEEMSLGACSVAVPIRRGGSDVVAAARDRRPRPHAATAPAWSRRSRSPPRASAACWSHHA